MTVILITPWLAAIVGILSAGLATAYPSLDQYSERNHYRVPYHGPEDWTSRGIPPRVVPADDVAFDKQIADKWPRLPADFGHDYQDESYKVDFATLDDHNKADDVSLHPYAKKNSFSRQRFNPFIAYMIEPERDSAPRNITKVKINNEKKNALNVQQAHELQAGCESFESNPQKRSSASLESDASAKKKESGEQTAPAMSLQELLELWGIDTSHVKPTVRSQRGDIEVTELAPKGRGDLPASILYGDSLVARQKSKREATSTGRKLLWAREDNQAPQQDMWGFAEDDGLLMSDQASDEDTQQIKGPGHHRKHHHPGNAQSYHDNEMRRMQERQRVEEERRRQWEEQERRRIESNERNEGRKTVPNDNNSYEERRRQWEEQERRRVESNRGNEGRKSVPNENNSYEERRRQWEEQERRRAESNRENEGRKTAPNENDTYEERMREWQRKKDEYDRMVRERENNRHRGSDRRSQEDLERERKLQDYIRSNTPIVVGNRGGHNRSQPASSYTMPGQRRPQDSANRSGKGTPEDERLEEYRKRVEDERKHHDPQRGQYEEQMRRREEEYRRRLEEEKRLREANVDERRRYEDPRQNQRTNNDDRIRENEQIRRAELEKRRQEEERRKQVEEQSKRYEEQRRHHEARYKVDQGIKGHPSSGRPYHPVRGETRKDGYDDLQRAIPPEEDLNPGIPKNHREESKGQDSRRDPNARNRPTTTTRRPWWNDRSPVETDSRDASIERRRQEAERRKEPEAGDNAESKGWPPARHEIPPKGNQDPRSQGQRRWEEEENNRRYLEFKKNSGRTSQLPVERPRQPSEEDERLRRLKGMPVSATIIVRSADAGANANNSSSGSNTPPAINLRQAIGDEIDFPGFSPAKKGPEASRFPAPPTERPPAKSPPACVWAIVVCCKYPKNSERLRGCFEATDCPGASWDSERCRDQNVRAANNEIMKFYLKGQPRQSAIF